MYGYKDICRQSSSDLGGEVLHRVLMLFRSATVACTNGKVNHASNVSTTFITPIVCHVLGTTYWDCSELWGLKIVLIPSDFLQLAALGSIRKSACIEKNIC